MGVEDSKIEGKRWSIVCESLGFINRTYIIGKKFTWFCFCRNLVYKDISENFKRIPRNRLRMETQSGIFQFAKSFEFRIV